MALDFAAAAENFGQKVDLTARLREILAAYPEGTTVLRELLQNAVRARRWQRAHALTTRGARAR